MSGQLRASKGRRGSHLWLRRGSSARPALSRSRSRSRSASVGSSDRRSARTLAVDDEPDASASAASEQQQQPQPAGSRWARLAAGSGKKPPATMLSISFFPWKMEAFGYYSDPAAAAAWVPDTASMRCQICLAAFSLLRRRHHCRLCGHLVCRDCSLARTFLPFSCARSQHHMIRDGVPQRSCNSCASTLLNMAAQHDPRVHKFTVSSTSRENQGRVDVDRPKHWRARLLTRSRADELEKDQALATRASSVPRCSSVLSAAQAEEVDEILYARAISHSKSMVKQFVVNAQWLDQWLQYVHMDAATVARMSSASARTSSRAVARESLSSPRPGPVTNYALLDFVNGSLVPRKDLKRSFASGAKGDYYVVSEEVWLIFLRLYGGGPSIHAPASDLVRAPSSNHETDRTAPTESESTGNWIITELSDSTAPVAAVPKGIGPHRIGSASFRRTELCAGKQKPRTARSSIVHETDSRSSSRALRGKSNRDSNSRWAIGRAWSFRRSSKCGDSMLTHTFASDGAIVHSSKEDSAVTMTSSQARLAHCSSSRSTKESSSRDAESISHHRRNYSLLDNAKELTDDDEAYSRSTIAAISAFASAATEARRRSAMSLSRHPSSRLIGPKSTSSVA